MAKSTKTCRIPKASGDRAGGEGFTRMGKLNVIETAAASSPPPFTKGSKSKGSKSH